MKKHIQNQMQIDRAIKGQIKQQEVSEISLKYFYKGQIRYLELNDEDYQSAMRNIIDFIKNNEIFKNIPKGESYQIYGIVYPSLPTQLN